MRIHSIMLAWFRGAADSVSLETNSRSVVVYGTNGAGKSCFVDAVEYGLHNGRIDHLAHEHSGKHQEKAILNTHKPDGRQTELAFEFSDGSKLGVSIDANGSPTLIGGETAAMHAWDYRRTILRQDEVSRFIHDTKGGKYSALLPLLGLEPLEIGAENLRQLARALSDVGDISAAKADLKRVEEERKREFGDATVDEISDQLKALHKSYCSPAVAGTGLEQLCSELENAVEQREETLSGDLALHSAQLRLSQFELDVHISDVRDRNARLAESAEPLISEKLAVLENAGSFGQESEVDEEVECPACGTIVPVESFKAHVTSEQQRLRGVLDTFRSRKTSINSLCGEIKNAKTELCSGVAEVWCETLTAQGHGDHLACTLELDPEAVRESCTEEILISIEKNVLPLIGEAKQASGSAPPDIRQLNSDRKNLRVARMILDARETGSRLQKVETVISFLNALESGVREEIRKRADHMIKALTSDIQAMWKILHPNEAIEDIHLYVPTGSDKAIDIGIRFHGVIQDSPRLTLSEGHRNSLGLCIFLAMAKRDQAADRPLILDDVVVSLDRNHRGMIAELLEKEFPNRQVILLTHDRDWYTELRHQLDTKNWGFKVLLPYESPATGIRWSHRTTTFEDARAQLRDRPDSAGNDARKIMDVELASIAERLQLKMLFLRGDRNDKRLTHDFLVRLISDGERCFKKKLDSGYQPFENALASLKNADRLVISWANRASHSFDLVRPEAEKLIDACEEALGFFLCSSCGKPVWFADATNAKLVQCQCGQIQWRYGKG